MPRPSHNAKGERYIRLDTLEPVAASSPQILWGAPCKAVEVNRWHLFKEPKTGRVPYLLISERRGVRLVPGIAGEVARKAVLFHRDGDGCFYCGIPMTAETATVEHLVAVAHGGPEHASNLVLSCASCNHMAGALPAHAKMRLAVERRVGAVVRCLPDLGGVLAREVR